MKNTVRLRPLMPATGTSVRSAPASARPSANALSGPASTIQMRNDEFSTGSVSEMRSAGGFGELRTGITAASMVRMPSLSGKSDATCPSGPTPRNVMSNRGSPVSPFACAASSAVYAATASSRLRPASLAPMAWTFSAGSSM